MSWFTNNYKMILDIIKTISQVALVGIAGTWLSLSKLNLSKRKEKREINKETNKQKDIFIKNIYIPFRQIKYTIKNITKLTKDKNYLFYKNPNISSTPYNQIPNTLQKIIKQHLYKKLLIQYFIRLTMWSNNLNSNTINKKQLLKETGQYYKWIMDTFHKDLSQIDINNQYQICYIINREIIRRNSHEIN